MSVMYFFQYRIGAINKKNNITININKIIWIKCTSKNEDENINKYHKTR
jgi:hypothetical protein